MISTKTVSYLAAAAIALGAASSGFASVIINYTLGLDDMTGAPLTLNADGSYHLTQGEEVEVAVYAQITGYNTTGHTHGTVAVGAPLGGQAMNVDLVPAGANPTALTPDTSYAGSGNAGNGFFNDQLTGNYGSFGGLTPNVISSGDGTTVAHVAGLGGAMTNTFTFSSSTTKVPFQVGTAASPTAIATLAFTAGATANQVLTLSTYTTSKTETVFKDSASGNTVSAVNADGTTNQTDRKSVV